MNAAQTGALYLARPRLTISIKGLIMPTAKNDHTPTRRSALGFSAAALAAGLTVPALAASSSPDAGLIRLSAEAVTWKAEFDALHATRKTVEQERQTEAQLDALFQWQFALMGKITAACPPSTMAGIAALARASLAFAMLDDGGEPYFEGGEAEDFALVVVRALANGGLPA
jgi:hypothetical protein